MAATLQNIVLILGTTTLLWGCSSSKKGLTTNAVMDIDYCFPVSSEIDAHIIPNTYNTDSLLKYDTQLTARYSRKEILLANATGIIPELKKALTFAADITGASEQKLMLMQFKLQQKIVLIHNAMDNTAAELYCEQERTRRISGVLINNNQKSTNKLTVASLIAGAATGLAPALIEKKGPQNAVLLTGGVITGLVSLALIKSSNKKITFKYQRNFLSDVWYGPEKPKALPQFIYLLLNTKEFSIQDGKYSTRENIKRRWSLTEFGTDTDASTYKLMFGDGGNFDTSDLNLRIALLNQLESTLKLLDTDISSALTKMNNFRPEPK